MGVGRKVGHIWERLECGAASLRLQISYVSSTHLKLENLEPAHWSLLKIFYVQNLNKQDNIHSCCTFITIVKHSIPDLTTVIFITDFLEKKLFWYLVTHVKLFSKCYEVFYKAKTNAFFFPHHINIPYNVIVPNYFIIVNYVKIILTIFH